MCSTPEGGWEVRRVACYVVLMTLALVVPCDAFDPGDELIVYNYQPEAERKETISSHPVPVSLTAFIEFEKAAAARNPRGYNALEKQGDLFWVMSGTRCRVVGFRPGRVLESTRIRDAYEIHVLNGDHKGKEGYILASLLRKRPRIVIEPVESINDANRDLPSVLAFTIQAQDKMIYRELAAAVAKASAAARTLPKGNAKRQGRYNQVFQRELKPILDRYNLDEATASRILDWGRAGDWPTGEPKDTPKPGR
jgi:ribosomal protein L24